MEETREIPTQAVICVEAMRNIIVKQKSCIFNLFEL